MKPYYLMNRIINRVFRVGEIMLIEKDLKDACEEQCHIASLEFKWLESQHVNEIVNLKHLPRTVLIKHFHQGSRCLGAYINNDLVGYVWQHFNTYSWPFFNYSINFSEKAYIGTDFVRVESRGKRLHGALLCFMFNELYAQGYQRALGSVWTNNVSSIKGLARVGFYPTISIFAVRIMNVLVYRRFKEINQWSWENIYKKSTSNERNNRFLW